MSSIASIVAAMRANPKNIRYGDLHKVCEHYFGHRALPVDRMRCSGLRGRVIRGSTSGSDHGKAKPYQVRQVLAAIEKKEDLGRA
ncbi:hypothetical protein ATK17_3138 [Branchiibius hedensis]|uniref:Toxin HicA n=1 Tax=Branchiibius hedensis TaxID=672460 RepID=A0A2Y8ZW50_9MICO|nr:toxin HicA [Branchiibius hedensis]PWJ26955.1 hypothetical protein ATK17_3138 [Branchiibius hedensis]SSA35766.1 hypothetical protein SAMN04489750_3138 [Branchiibius hedensis]